MNDLFYLDHDLDVNIVWHKDGQDAIQTIVDEMHFPGRIGIDKNWASHFLLDLMKNSQMQSISMLHHVLISYA